MITPIRISGAVAALLLIAIDAPASAQGRSAPAAAAGAANAAATRPAPTSWLADSRALAVGDVITLHVDDAVIASARKSQTGRDNTQREMGVALSPPGGSAPIQGSFGDSKRASSDQTGDMSRATALRTTVAVRVIARQADGTYQVKGTRAVNVDKNQQEVTVEGILRAQDVSIDNQADGDRLADAKITVKQKGRLGKTRGGIVGRILGLVWP
jgi:flagellar L-ring protein FlgH